jgi:choline-sulfatase
MSDALPVHQASWERYLGFGATQADMDRGLAGYSGSVSYLDEMIGHLVASLKHMGYGEDTLIIYSSDHGDMAGAHGLWHKQLFYEESGRVPLLFSGPGVAQGEERDHIVSLVDMFPTLCEAAGLAIPDHCDGLSLAPLLQEPGELADRSVFSEIVYDKDSWRGCMLRRGPWKYCWYVGDHEELFNLDTDPGEDSNLVGNSKFQDVRNELREELLEWWDPDDIDRRVGLLPTTNKEDKHFMPFQNVLSDGQWVDAWP